jgi:hypothetical protein
MARVEGGQDRFRVNSPTVVSETVDGEVVMIHLDSGNYYSLRSTGSYIWDAIERGVSLPAITAALAAASRNGADVDAQVGAFVDELRAENLIVPADLPSPPGSDSAATDSAPVTAEDFEQPVLEKYTDMQHLILLDPVHEVDEGEGWPRPRDDA